MKGLMIKDIRLLLQQRTTLLMFFAIGLFLMLSGNNALFVVNYMIYVIATYAMGSVAYDTHDNGMAFLMTLPASKMEYVIGKYILIFGSSFFMGIVFAVGISIVSMIRGNQVQIGMVALEVLASMLMVMVIFSIMIPINIKYGTEKSRIVFLLVAGIVFGVLYLVEKLGIEDSMEMDNALQELGQLEVPVILLCGVILAAVAVCVSVNISNRIMHKKEF